MQQIQAWIWLGAKLLNSPKSFLAENTEPCAHSEAQDMRAQTTSPSDCPSFLWCVLLADVWLITTHLPSFIMLSLAESSESDLRPTGGIMPVRGHKSTVKAGHAEPVMSHFISWRR